MPYEAGGAGSGCEARGLCPIVEGEGMTKRMWVYAILWFIALC